MTAAEVKGRFASPQEAKDWSPPTFTLKQVRDAIPKHCFNRSTITSLSYVAVDVSMATALVVAASNIHRLPSALQFPAWVAYSIAQGIVGVGLWILAHECGHGAFSDYTMLNNCVGWVLHSVVGIPFFSWKFTHSTNEKRHHKATGHLTKDMVHIPNVRSNKDPNHVEPATPIDPMHEHEDSLFEDTPIYSLLYLAFILVFGFPLYLLFNFGGQKAHTASSHYLPDCALFEAKQARGVLLSNAGLILWISILSSIGVKFGTMVPVVYFVLPWMQVNAWLVLITYLQHTDGKVPHYTTESWDFLRGALATVDRDWGVLNIFFHHITDTHVVHHLFSTMPFYHAQEATEAVKKVLGKHYVFDPTPAYQAVWNSVRTCKFVEDTGDVLWYKY